MNRLVYLKDRFLEEDKASVSFLDLSLQRGYSIFDFFRLVGNQPLHLEDHLDRFYFSAEQMRLPIPKTREEIKQIIKELIWENELPGSGIRIQLTGGANDDGIVFTSPTLLISQLEFSPPSIAALESGIRLASYAHQRQLPQVKSTDYLMAIWLQPWLKEQNADDIIYHSNGCVRECPRSNFFIVTPDGQLVTPGEHILKGITRKKLIHLAARESKVEEREIPIEEVLHAKEAFISSTTKQIVPVTTFDGRKVGEGTVGPITRKLMLDLKKLTGID